MSHRDQGSSAPPDRARWPRVSRCENGGVGCWDAAVPSRGMSTQLRLAVVPGDGIGTEVVAEGLKVLDVVAARHGLAVRRAPSTTSAPGATHATGEVLPESVLDGARARSDAILLGAVGDPSVPPGVLERGLLLRLRFELDHHVNLRPVKLFPGVSTPLAGKGPEHIDMVVCREGTEGPYAGAGGVLREGTPHEVATEESVNTALRRRAHRARRVRPRRPAPQAR